MPSASILIRTKNEERWVGRCLRMIQQQSVKDFEVLVVDNQSEDNTLKIARKFPVKVLAIDSYTPGKALNIGARESRGDFFVCLSAHCIPRDTHWLANLLKNTKEDVIAGVYGRQLPMAYSSNLDKRDLLITFGLDSRIQIKDSFFHNANSLVRKKTWEEIPFDEKVTNIEDRIWAKNVIQAGYRLAYEPEAAVYHYHGIHQSANEERAKNVVKILESVEDLHRGAAPFGFHPETMNVVAFLPVFGKPVSVAGRNLLARCIKEAKASRYIKKVMVVGDTEEAKKTARRCGVDMISRPRLLAQPEVTVENVLQYALEKYEAASEFADAVVYINYLYPFRPVSFFNDMIEEYAKTGVETLIPTLKDYQPYWTEHNGKIVSGDAMFAPRQFKTPMQKGIVGLGSITGSELVRRGILIGSNVGLVPFEKTVYSIKVADPFTRKVAAIALRDGIRALGGWV